MDAKQYEKFAREAHKAVKRCADSVSGLTPREAINVLVVVAWCYYLEAEPEKKMAVREHLEKSFRDVADEFINFVMGGKPRCN